MVVDNQVLCPSSSAQNIKFNVRLYTTSTTAVLVPALDEVML